jgi:hypothetical protein
MMLQNKTRKRSGAYLVECAFILPITFFLLLAIMIGSLGIFRFQECAYLARLGARFGSVRGDNYWYYQRTPPLRPPGSSPGLTASPSSYTDSTTGTSYLVYTPTSSNVGPAPTGSPYTSWCDDIYGNRIYPNLMLLDPNSTSCTIAWPTVALNPSMPDNAPGSQLRVTVNYQWIAGFSVWLPGLGEVDYGGVTLSSTSSMPITN